MKKVLKHLFLILIIILVTGCNEHEHNYKETIVLPTCSTEGYTMYSCACGESYKDNYVEKIEHVFGEWVIIKEASETETGFKNRTCINCGVAEGETIEKLTHEHIFDKETVLPTCTENGYIIEVCKCGETHILETLESSGHNFGDWIIETEPNENNDGLKYRECSECSFKEEEIIFGPSHTHDYSLTIIPSTCTQEGYTLYECMCGDTYKHNYTELKEHSYGDWIIKNEPTDTENGYKYQLCSECAYENGKIIPPNTHVHNYGDWSLFESNSLGGVKVKTCEGCGDSEYEDFVLTNPAYTVPTDLEINFGQTLNDLVLPSGFEIYEEQNISFDNVGMYTIYLNYEDQSKFNWLYNKIYMIEAVITVKSMLIDVNVDLSYLDELIYTGKSIDLPCFEDNVKDLVKITFKQGEEIINDLPKNVGDYQLIIESNNNNFTFEKIIKLFTINKNDNYLDIVEVSDKYYTSESVDFSELFDNTAKFTYKQYGELLESSPIEVGDYSVIIEIEDTVNYASQIKEFEFSILEDTEAPTWYEDSLITSDVNVKVEASDNGKVMYYIITVLSNAIENIRYFKSIDGSFIGEIGYNYYCEAIDASGNISSALKVFIENNDKYIPNNVYPNNEIVNKSYVELVADGATRFMIGTSVEEMQYVGNGYSYIYHLENNTTYYWKALKGHSESEVYSFDVKYEEVGNIKNIYPLNCSTVTEEFPMLIVESDEDFKIYYSYSEDRAFNEYYSNNSSSRVRLFNNRIVYWYAEDVNGNRTDVWSFTYKYNKSQYQDYLYMVDSDTVSYIGREYITYWGYAELGINYFEILILNTDGTYSYIQNSDFFNKNTCYTNINYAIGESYKFENGQTVYVCLIDTQYQRSEHKKFIIDLENPICGSVSAEFIDKWNINITMGTDNIGADYYYRINNGQWEKYDQDLSLELDKKQCLIDLKAVDYAGNCSYNSYKFSDDVTLPNINILEGEFNNFVNTNVKVKVSPIDACTSYYFINGTQTLITEEMELEFTEEGITSFYVGVLIDDVLYVSSEYKIMIDKTAPEFGEIFYLDHRFSINNTYTYAFIDYDKIEDISNVEVYYKLDPADKNWMKIDKYGHAKLYSYYFSISGYFDLSFKIVDEAGNETIKTVQLLIDTVGPSLDNIKFECYYDKESNESKYIVNVTDIIDDYGYYYHMHFQIWDQYSYDNNLESIVNESFYVEKGTTEFSFDMSYLPNGTTYYYLIYVVDDLKNGTYSDLYYFYKYDLKTAVEIDGFHFELTNGKYNLFKYTGEEENLVFPESVNGETYSIGDRVFSGNNKIKSLLFSNGVTSIGMNAFSNCTSLETVIMSDSIVKMGNTVFDGCTSLKNVTLSNNIKSIGDYCFYDCNSLIYNEYENGYYLGSAENKYLLFMKVSNNAPNFVVHEDTIKIEAGAFYENTTLESIKLPTKLLDIGVEAFSNCTNLKEISIPEHVTIIKDFTFFECINLEKIDLNNAKVIGSYAFNNCDSLIEINIPNSVETIKDSAFSSNDGLETLTIGTNLKILGDEAFFRCSKLKTINFNAILMNDLTTTSHAFDSYLYADYGLTIYIGNEVQRIPSCLLYGRKNVISIVFEEDSNCKSIGEFAFRACELVEEIIIPEGVISIENNAFLECDNLKHISLPNSLESIGGTGLNQCDFLVYNEYNNGLYLGNEENPYLILIKVKLTSENELITHEKTKFIHTLCIMDSMTINKVYISKNVKFIAINAFISNLLEEIVFEDINNWYCNGEIIQNDIFIDKYVCLNYIIQYNFLYDIYKN